ncbi:DUF2244 domain-containing protein [Actibacterium pelagium]|uniref:Integral membrane protein n=1 Tax=Actibacterium pelagium TaxID=2029103 RepID=A0A917EMQ2_9RHOB|nr:DUF2244 domain-containing protein [Actibacterium pelagium]GGE57363.1 hypothetical protein GCM10011517_26420 [Actibacterium pelagium]
MPYEWIAPNQDGEPTELHLWPYRSLPKRGFVIFIGVTAAFVLLPLIAVLGSPILWGILPFIVGAVWAMWYFLQRSYKDGEVLEELCIWDDRMTLTRHNPRAPKQEWEANPYWVKVELLAKGGPVEHYLILKGGNRTVELGAFLTPEERERLAEEIPRILQKVSAP